MPRTILDDDEAVQVPGQLAVLNPFPIPEIRVIIVDVLGIRPKQGWFRATHSHGSVYDTGRL